MGGNARSSSGPRLPFCALVVSVLLGYLHPPPISPPLPTTGAGLALGTQLEYLTTVYEDVGVYGLWRDVADELAPADEPEYEPVQRHRALLNGRRAGR